jgi:hypothetical protein
MGFDLNFGGARPQNVAYQLDPTPVTLQRDAFAARMGEAPATAGQFNTAAFTQFGVTAGPGTSLLPVRSDRLGARDAPFTFVVEENSNTVLNCVIFRTVTSPISWVQGRIGGYLIHRQLSSMLIQRDRPR